MRFPERSSLALGRLGIVIVDMQTEYIDLNEDYKGGKATLLEAHDILIDWVEKNGGQTRIYPVEMDAHGPTVTRIWNRIGGKSYCKAPIRKRKLSGFSGTDLQKTLVDDGIKTVIAVGVSATACLCQTADDSACFGFETIVPEDAIAGVCNEFHVVFQRPFDKYEEGGNYNPLQWLSETENVYLSHATVADWLGLIDAAQVGDSEYHAYKLTVSRRLLERSKKCANPACTPAEMA